MENSLLCCIKCDLSIISIWFDKVNFKIYFFIYLYFDFSGQGVVYYIDELTASLQLAYKIQLSVENFPGIWNDIFLKCYFCLIDLVENLGALCSMKWSPDYR